MDLTEDATATIIQMSVDPSDSEGLTVPELTSGNPKPTPQTKPSKKIEQLEPQKKKPDESKKKTAQTGVKPAETTPKSKAPRTVSLPTNSIAELLIADYHLSPSTVHSCDRSQSVENLSSSQKNEIATEVSPEAAQSKEHQELLDFEFSPEAKKHRLKPLRSDSARKKAKSKRNSATATTSIGTDCDFDSKVKTFLLDNAKKKISTRSSSTVSKEGKWRTTYEMAVPQKMLQGKTPI